MILSKPSIPLYGVIVVMSIIIGIVYIYNELKKEKVKNKQIIYYFLIYLSFSFIGGKLFTILTSNVNFLEAGLSSYGGFLGVIVGSIIFEKILPIGGLTIKYSILSLPLVYGLSKIACFISGCCFGIPYNGLFYVIYKDGLNIKLFPIQIVETFCFLILFTILHFKKNNKNIIYITIISSALLKFLLDFLRYDHLNIILTANQIFSLILITFLIIFLFIRKQKIKKI